MSIQKWGRTVCATAVLALVALSGCREHMPHSGTWPATGDTIPTHPEPPEGGYYTNWDPFACTLELEPAEDVNPVKTQHVMIATVRDKDGKPLPNRRIEWIIAEGGIGNIVEVDESGWRASRGYKLTNSFAVSHTNNYAHVMTRGTEDTSDDISIGVGQTWCVITSPVEGDTHIIAYCPAIFDWEKHKAFAVKHWYDVDWEWPPPAVNMVGTPHQMVTRVFKHSDGSPLVGYKVTYKLVSGPAGNFGSGTSTMVETDSSGMATVTLNQDQPVEGMNDIEIDIARPENVPCCKPGAHIATGHTTKTWQAPQIKIAKTAPARALINEHFNYGITVSNPARMQADDVTVRDNLPNGIEYVSSNPPASVSGQTLSWSLGTLNGGMSAGISVTVKAGQPGTYHNCADVTAAHGLSDNACADTVVVAPALALDLHCEVEKILCEPLPYKVTVRNTGEGRATNVMVTAQLPEGLTAQDGRSTLTFSAGSLEPGQSKEASFSLKAAHTGSYPVRAVASADNNLSAQADCTTRVTKPELSVVKTGPAVRYQNRPMTYEITVTNTGDAPARDTVLVDPIPAGVQFSKANDGGNMSGGSVTWNLGTLAPGASKTVSADVIAQRMGNITNTATARAFCAEGSGSFTMEVKGKAGILLEVVDHADPIEVGNDENYTITVTNQGSLAGTNIVITCTLPSQQEFVRSSPAANVAGDKVTFPAITSLAPGARASVTVTVKGNQPGDVRFRVDMTSDQLEGEPVMETESTHIYGDN